MSRNELTGGWSVQETPGRSNGESFEKVYPAGEVVWNLSSIEEKTRLL